ncbi:MAG: ECF transporter S component [Candidatus Eremiobacteraeota bacterium]|nr:ECF transporter S component [Candidatus Eremiobacteraeota bacterium]
MRKRGRSYEIAVIAILAACNATIELTLGNYLHIIKFPLSGSILVGFNIIIYSLGYAFVPKRGTVISMGFLTVIINLFFGGSFKILAIIAIFLEAALVEIIFNTMKFHFWSIMTASVITNLFGYVLTLVIYAFFIGIGLINAIHRAFARFTSLFPWAEFSIITIFLMLIVYHILVAVIFGMLAWKLIKFVEIFMENHKNGKVLEKNN